MVLVDDIDILGSDNWLPNTLATHIDGIRDTGSVFVWKLRADGNAGPQFW